MTPGQRAWSRSLLSGVVGFLAYQMIVGGFLHAVLRVYAGYVLPVWVHLALGTVAALAVGRAAYVHAPWGRVCGILGIIVSAMVAFELQLIRAIHFEPPVPLVFGLGIPLCIALAGLGCLVTSRRMPIKRELHRR